MWVVVCAFACDPLLTHTHTGPDSCSFFCLVPLYVMWYLACGARRTNTHIHRWFVRERVAQRIPLESAQKPPPLKKGRSITQHMDKSEGNQTRGLLGCCWKCFPHTKGRKKKRGEESYYIVEEYYIGKREGGEKERTLFIELPTISKMDAPVQDLMAGAATFFCTDFSG